MWRYTGHCFCMLLSLLALVYDALCKLLLCVLWGLLAHMDRVSRVPR